MINPAANLAGYIKTLDDLRLKLVKYLSMPDALDPRGCSFQDGYTQQPKTVTYTFLIALLKQCDSNQTVYTQKICRALNMSMADVQHLLEVDAALAEHPDRYELFSADEALSSPYGSTTGVHRLIALNTAIQGFKQTNDEQLVLCAAKHKTLLSRSDQELHKDTITLLAQRFAALSFMRDAKMFLEWDAFNASLGEKHAYTPLSVLADDFSAHIQKLGTQIERVREDQNGLAHPAFVHKGAGQQVKSKFKAGLAAWNDIEVPEGYAFNASKVLNVLSMQLALVKTRQEALQSCVVQYSDLHDKILAQDSQEKKMRISK